MMLGFTACSGDDAKDVEKGNSSIIGVWESLDTEVINGHKGTLQVEFRTNKKGTMSALYTDGTDPDSYNFEYVIATEGDYMYITLIWTGTKYLVYPGNRQYKVVVSPTRLIWEKGTLKSTFIRK